MKISKIIVKNYRSIKKAEINLDKFSVFVGQNNHGKTNFFESVEWFYKTKSSKKDEHFNRNESNEIAVEIFFEGVTESDIEKLKTDAHKTKIKNLLKNETKFSVKKTSADHKRKYFINGEEKQNPSGLDTAINEFLPKIEYVNTKIRLDDVSKYKDKNQIGQMLSGILSAVIENSQEYIDFKDKFSKLFENENSEARKNLNELGSKVEVYLKKQFPEGTTVRFSVNPPHFYDLLKNFDTTIDDGVETKAEDKGDGMQRALMLSIIQAFADYRKEKTGGGTFLFLIDEAELHLHPSAQRALKKALLDISKTDQVLINTHSSVLVADDAQNQKIFKTEKIDKITYIKEVDNLEKINIIFDLLGGSPSDLLLPRNFFIVEGKSEFEFISAVIKRFYPEKYKGIKILFAGGDLNEQERSLHSVHKLYNPLAGSDNPIYKNKAVILIDKPNEKQKTQYDNFKKGYPFLFEAKQVFELPVESLEEYYPGEYKRSKGEINSKEKVDYAKRVAQSLKKNQFESNMKVIFEALKACDSKGFDPKEE